jgi:uncharacterized small protein (DUF1192 family)
VRVTIHHAPNGGIVIDTADSLARIASLVLPLSASEEDVKIRIVMPFLRAFGYSDDDFGYEGRTGKGYVDIATSTLPVGIVVEAKGPKKRVSDHINQLESYVFEKHGRDRATIAILTNGEVFHMYGVTEALWRGDLHLHQLECFRRSEFRNPALLTRLGALLTKERNGSGLLFDSIAARLKEVREMRERVGAIDAELARLRSERQRIDDQIHDLESERASLVGTDVATVLPAQPASAGELPAGTSSDKLTRIASPHILRLLHERGATSRERAVQRSSLDQALIGKVQGIDTQQEVSWGIIELKRVGRIDYDKSKSGPVRSVWLK